ncbi:MAG: hypothetical protein KIT31_23785 [Deltaproteobacteria bacterium]|nr:hypothetical protein [Deltaproteobacteria bacterium]
MSRWLLVLVLSVASATAWAQSVPTSRATVTARAQQTVVDAERRVAAQTTAHGTAVQRYDEHNDAVQRLKREKASWRRERELRDALAEAKSAGDRADVAARELARAQAELLSARRALARAIDDELASNTAAPQRTKDLTKVRAQLAPIVGQRAQRILIPEVDLSADPEELRDQAAALRKTEAQLQAQLDGLDAQVKKLEDKSDLEMHHNRAKELSSRDDNTPGQKGSSGGRESVSATPGPGGAGGAGFDMAAMFAAATAGALGEVVDSSTLETFQRHWKGNDSKRQLESAKKVRAQVEAQRAKVRADRVKIERLTGGAK